MSKIFQLDPSYDLWLTYSWSNNNHGVCGHIFEVIDYYYILKSHFKVGIFLAEDITWETIEQLIRSKYTFTDAEIEDMRVNTVFNNRPRILRGKNILITDGGVVNMSSVAMYFDNIFYFPCGNKEIKNNDKDNVYVLQDDRVYEPVLKNGINYKKRILFDKLKPVGIPKRQSLVYATKNCRNIDDWGVFKKYGQILAIVNHENKPEPVEGVEFIVPPVENIFDQFDTYVYTPVQRQWDCSPRFIAECKYFNKLVIYHDIDYWDVDHGLYWRWTDIHNDFPSLHLRPDDKIISILKGII